jgi:hypothetical protein
MKKTNCIYCNIEDAKYEDYVIIKCTSENTCVLCEKEYENNDSKYYSLCCNKNTCKDCLKECYDKYYVPKSKIITRIPLKDSYDTLFKMEKNLLLL